MPYEMIVQIPIYIAKFAHLRKESGEKYLIEFKSNSDQSTNFTIGKRAVSQYQSLGSESRLENILKITLTEKEIENRFGNVKGLV